MDVTESIRKAEVSQINQAVGSDSESSERARLESEYGQVWNTAEMSEDFEVTGFMTPYVVVTRKADGVRGSLQFQHRPRFYFNFKADS